MDSFASSIPLVAHTRCGVREILHHGIISVWSSEIQIGRIGDTSTLVPLRSTGKPFFLGALLAEILEGQLFSPAELAIMSASHNGEPAHIDCVVGLLKRYGLQESDLRCGTHARFHRDSVVTLAGNQCSGKHALFMIASALGGWPVQDYLDPNAPIHTLIRRALQAELFPSACQPGPDGCSLPTYAVSIDELARAYSRFAVDSIGPTYSVVRRAHLAASYYVGGTDRLESYLIESYKLAAKSGSDGLWAVGVPSRGLGVAAKVFTGHEPAVQAAVLETLRQLNVLDPLKDSYLVSYYRSAVRSLTGEHAGEIATCFPQFLQN